MTNIDVCPLCGDPMTRAEWKNGEIDQVPEKFLLKQEQTTEGVYHGHVRCIENYVDLDNDLKSKLDRRMDEVKKGKTLTFEQIKECVRRQREQKECELCGGKIRADDETRDFLKHNDDFDYSTEEVTAHKSCYDDFNQWDEKRKEDVAEQSQRLQGMKFVIEKLSPSSSLDSLFQCHTTNCTQNATFSLRSMGLINNNTLHCAKHMRAICNSIEGEQVTR